ncbi:acid phosphatase family membrane protein YuiD [Methanococcus maripaludis]|uniref:Acid phosphatase family membrane protein YuiD n=1 Tax=Methanococcus maripaludis TaxID=39152 RepID=A0A7J9NW38_METMI|nr:hypothetical protein [Methanococcus maripaludis]MBA2851537.1 acid phosphatase family membrane protein YuiD [Methanococcus maripaludis]
MVSLLPILAGSCLVIATITTLFIQKIKKEIQTIKEGNSNRADSSNYDTECCNNHHHDCDDCDND